jgi:hypothetical protein
MIKRKLTNMYLSSFDLLTEALYLCWTNSFCVKTDQLNKEMLKDQIRSYGFYDHKHAIKKEKPINFINNFQFKTLIWANKFSKAVNQDALSGYVELYKLVVDEIENNLFILKSKTAQIAYANILLRNLDKSHIHKRKLDIAECDRRYKEMFGLVLNRKFILDNETTVLEGKFCNVHTNYDLTVRLINHLDFVDKLIELFSCFEIDLISLAKKYKHNLYIFDTDKSEIEVKSEHEASIETPYHITERNNFQNNILPKFNTSLSDDCLIKIMQYLFHKKMLDNPNLDLWFFWFNRKYIKVPEPLKWRGTPSMLSNIIQHICGESISNTIKTAFCMNEYVKPTKSKYEHSRMHKEIEQIITISKQKNN